MYPTTTYDVARFEQAHRLEGYRRWSLRRSGPAGAADPTDSTWNAPPGAGPTPSSRGGRRTGHHGLRAVLGR